MYPHKRGGCRDSAACAFAEGIAVSALRHFRVILMSPHRDAVQTAVVLSHHIVLALRNAALDTFVLTFVIIHSKLLSEQHRSEASIP